VGTFAPPPLSVDAAAFSLLGFSRIRHLCGPPAAFVKRPASAFLRHPTSSTLTALSPRINHFFSRCGAALGHYPRQDHVDAILRTAKTAAMNIHVIATRSAAGSFRCGLQNNRKPFDQRRPANRITQRRTTGLAWPLLLAILAASPASAQQIQLPSKPEAALQPVQPQPNQARTNQVTPATATATAAAIPTPAATSGPASVQSVAPTTITPRADAVSNSDAARIKQAIDTLRKDDSLAEEIRRSSEEVLVRALKYIERRDKANAQTRQLKAAADSAAARKQAAEAATERPV
jgi:hypothetical protein